MSDRDRSGFGRTDDARNPVANAVDGHDDPNRGPLDRAENALTGHDDPNRGPLDRAANTITGHGGGVSAAVSDASSALSGHDDPSRGPVDRATNALSGNDDPNRGPLDRTANAVTGHAGGTAAAIGGGSALNTGSGEVKTVSAMFDSQAEAERAVSELRQHGVSDSSLSLIAQNKRTMTTRDADGEVTDEEHTNVLRGILGGGAAGAGLGVLALAIPGVGPLAALGAIAASAVPEAMAIGALAGAAAGTFNETLKKHGIDDADASYYGERLKTGGTLVTVQANGTDVQDVRDILHRSGGHSAAHARPDAM